MLYPFVLTPVPTICTNLEINNKTQKRSFLLDTEVSPYSCGNTFMDVVSKRNTVNK